MNHALVVSLLCLFRISLSIVIKDPPVEGIDYNYSYNIEDPTTGDSKSQHEVRKGDVVTGSYSVLDPDGTKRTVHYTADAKNGFQAVVQTVPAVEKTSHEDSINYVAYQVEANDVPKPRYTSTISAPASYATYSRKSPANRASYDESDEIKVLEHRYFSPSPYRKLILSNSLLDQGQYFVQST